MQKLNLRASDRVFVRPAAQILDTLDDEGKLHGMPFMPEMLQYCGREFTVRKVAHKTCDTINNEGGRALRGSAVHLEELRCDGQAHGGCEAGCLLFWMEDWLSAEPVDADTQGDVDTAALSARTQSESEEGLRYYCQATELLDASRPLASSEAWQYLKDIRSRNHSVGNLARILSFALFQRLLAFGLGYGVLIRTYNAFQKLRGGKPYPTVNGKVPMGSKTPTGKLHLEPGERVRIRPIEEIEKTLNTGSFNRGMWFDPEMVKYCGEEYTVSSRVARIINEKSGVMMEMKSPCILLDDVYCRAECTSGRRGCPRAINTYWREIWLERVEDAGKRKTTSERQP